MADINTAYNQLATTRNQNPLASPTSTLGPVIGNSVGQLNTSALGGINVLQFPMDAPPNHFVIVECEYSGITGAQGSLTNFGNVYRLPLPVNLNNEYQVMFDADFNWMSLFSGLLPNNVRNIIGGIPAALGLAVNTYKQVNLAVPRFRRLALEWRLYPKTRQETDMITRIVHGMQTGMHPIQSTGVFWFPKVYLLQFNEGAQHLYKFKPCVLERINIDYTGGSGVPAFYKGTPPAPQGLIIRTAWIELELWIRQDFVADTADGMPTNNNGIVLQTPISGVVANSMNQAVYSP